MQSAALKMHVLASLVIKLVNSSISVLYLIRLRGRKQYLPNDQNIDEKGKSSPLRPGYPIMGCTHKIYGQLIPRDASVLSHVDLQVGGDIGWNTDTQALQTMDMLEGNSSHDMGIVGLSNYARRYTAGSLEL